MLIGQEEQERAWVDALASGRMPHAWLLAGPKGVGKAAFAMRAATFLLCDGDRRAAAGVTSLDIDHADPAAQQIAYGSHPDFIWLKREVPETKRPKDGSEGKVEDVARTINISQVRAMLARLRMRPSNSRWRAVVIDSIDDMERSAANALLKTLEEPPANTIFLLVSHQPGRLLLTIRSRCRMLRFNALGDATMRQFIKANIPAVSDDEAVALVAIAQGSPGRAALFTDTDLTGIARTLDAIAKTGDRDNAMRVELARAVVGSGNSRRMEMLLLQANSIATCRARNSSGNALLGALVARDHIADLARDAASVSADNATIAFAVGNALAALAGECAQR
ncbi:MAG: hypothetical protein ABL874_07820 [Sphingopyxis sp.]